MTYKIDKGSAANAKDVIVKMRCPACRQRGTFDPLATHDLHAMVKGVHRRFGIRRCPDPECHTLVFVISSLAGELDVSYPAERVDFDSTDLPIGVLKSLEEAISCHASQNYVAAAIMVRKTLEELCTDRKAAGKNLKEKISDIGTKIVIPNELLEGMDDLRLLGNDAAHIESQVYDDVGQEQVEIALEFTKEILKSVYQLSSLLSRLQKLKKGNNKA